MLSSSVETTVPYRPPMVITLSPAPSDFCIDSASLRRFAWGRMNMKYIKPKSRANMMIVGNALPELPPTL
ncbi:hypothetical protein GCM10028775_66460 [Catellatospora paridis]